VLRLILGPKSEEVAGDWRRLHSEELRNLYASPTIIKVINSTDYCEHCNEPLGSIRGGEFLE
jgi:hypothetical protein